MMKKVSITLSADVLAHVDQLAGSKHSRSAVIERVLRHYFRQRAGASGDVRDLELINEAAEQLNIEAAEVLKYQARK